MKYEDEIYFNLIILLFIKQPFFLPNGSPIYYLNSKYNLYPITQF